MRVSCCRFQGIPAFYWSNFVNKIILAHVDFPSFPIREYVYFLEQYYHFDWFFGRWKGGKTSVTESGPNAFKVRVSLKKKKKWKSDQRFGAFSRNLLQGLLSFRILSSHVSKSHSLPSTIISLQCRWLFLLINFFRGLGLHLPSLPIPIPDKFVTFWHWEFVWIT